jgi:putative endonuclease
MGRTQVRGAAGEALAAAYLELVGFTIERRNARIAGVEVDLVARDGPAQVLVEVKLRGRLDYGGAALAIDRSKRDRLIQAGRFLAAAGVVRIDVVAVEQSEDGAVVRHFRNAITE